ncbi:unnamed protein product [Echinostoma caproni]|uniref:Adaptin_N domain-containing protein n=1 Tax=Echinostoma caproni TaxID=27848 RepID=A0A183ANK1_9TREM|nr:unnamed protein product [Echinostoma caproni]
MTKILQYHPKIVQSHKDLIFRCLDDKDESIRLRALNLLHGMVTKKNLVEIVKFLMRHVANQSSGVHYRNELVSKLVHLCSQDNYHYVTSFEWYISVLVELARTEGVRNGTLLSDQLMDVAIRVPSVRTFCVEQMAILLNVCASTTTTLNAHQNALHVVVHAASWICGEYAKYLERPRQVLEDMISTANHLVDLPGHVQSVLVLNTFKLYCSLVHSWTEETATQCAQLTTDSLANVHRLLDRLLELSHYLSDKFALFVHSPDLEVQERAVSLHQLLSLVTRRLNKIQSVCSEEMPQLAPNVVLPNCDEPNGVDSMSPTNDSLLSSKSLAQTVLDSIQSLTRELDTLFAGEINPVAPKAQRKVPIPAELNLDEWINPLVQATLKPVEQSISPRPEPTETLFAKSKRLGTSSNHTNASNEIFSGLSTRSPKVVLTKEQLDEMRQRRLEQQQRNPHYLKSTTRTVNGDDRSSMPETGATSPQLSQISPNHEIRVDVRQAAVVQSDAGNF